MIWKCLSGSINSLVWANSIDDVALVWCDISTRLTIEISVAIPAASLCINCRLYKIASCQAVSTFKADKGRTVLVDLAIGLGHRYDILEDLGCYPTMYKVTLAYPLTYVWSKVINLISSCYVILTLRAFLRRGAQFTQFLSGNSGLTPRRYFRLMALTSLEILLNFPIATYGLYLTASSEPIAPVEQVLAILWHTNGHTAAIVELSRWAGVICNFFFFGFFGFAAEARKNYRFAFWAVAKRCGLTPPADGSLPFPGLRLPWTKPKPAPFTSDSGKSLPISLPFTPVKKRPDSSLFGDSRTEYDASDVHSMEKGAGRACEYILPSPSSSGPPQCARDIEAGAYATAYPSPSSTYTADTDLETDGYSEGQATPTSSQHHLHPTSPSPSDLESQRRTRPTTWPSLHTPRSPHAPAS
ncbi:putative pheromone receptor [Mycena albidolilacea]|uniref:Pheromone receptor n=1 Tax=Mycena albidolilacea TaxID=1033008 RepID=A0AAD6ZHF0_9AGAR|nr:putative pheromone receptor [Mycena albidolilacea]